MIVSQLAAVTCLGCVPLDDTVEYRMSEVSAPSSSSTELTVTPSAHPLIGEAVNIPASITSAPLSSMNLSTATTATKAVAGLTVLEKETPRPLRFEPVEQWTAHWTFTAPSSATGFGLDMAVAPRATLKKRGDFETTRAGAEFRLGQNLEELADRLDQRGRIVNVDSWYMFAGADGEAICWDVGDKGASLSGLALRDQISVGDVQAGVAFQKAGGELSIGYVHREVSAENASAKMDFAAISFTMKR